MKNAILNYFKYDRSYAAGVSLVIRYSPKMSLKRQVNIYPQGNVITGIVHEELRELAGISRDDLKELLSIPVSVAELSSPQIIESEQPVAPEEEKKASRKKSH